MVDAHLICGVVMADVVIVGLGQRNVNDAQNQNPDSKNSPGSMVCTPPGRHDHASIPAKPDRRLLR